MSHLIKYLVDPNVAAAGAPPCHSREAPKVKPAGESWRGNELTPMVCDILTEGSPFVPAAHMTLEATKDGNPVALYISRAQHETAEVKFPEHTAYYTVVSVAVALDVFTDQAAQLSTRRFESLYSRLQVVTQPRLTDAPLSEAALKEQYRQTFHDAVAEVASGAAEDLNAERTRSAAVFKIDHFTLPKEPQPAINQLVEAALTADGRPRDAQERQREVDRLTTEFEHTVHQFVLAELRRRGVSDIALLSPPSPWTDGHVLPLLQKRLAASDAPILSESDVTQMNGYAVTAGIVQTSTVTTNQRPGIASRVFTAQMAARIFRRPPDAPAQVMPASVTDLVSKTAVGSGGEGYLDVTELHRQTTREIAFSALRHASEDLAPKLVDLMVKTAREIN